MFLRYWYFSDHVAAFAKHLFHWQAGPHRRRSASRQSKVLPLVVKVGKQTYLPIVAGP